MSSSYEILHGIKTVCAAIQGVKTCQLGIETPMLPSSYPMIRVVLSVSREKKEGEPIYRPLLEVLVYYGEMVRPLAEDALDDQLEWLLATEDKIKTAVCTNAGWHGRWLETVWDEDRIPGLKIFASRFEVWGYNSRPK